MALTSSPHRGATLWLTGPSEATEPVARGLAAWLLARGARVELLAGEALRARLYPELGDSPEDRAEAARRVSLLARVLARNGVLVVCCAPPPPEGGARESASPAVTLLVQDRGAGRPLEPLRPTRADPTLRMSPCMPPTPRSSRASATRGTLMNSSRSSAASSGGSSPAMRSGSSA